MNRAPHFGWSVPQQSRGLTLVELMVAIVMGLVLLAGVATVFVANKQTYRVQDGLARNQENGRFALTIMARDIRMAGYAGCGSAAPSLLADTVCDSGKYPLQFGNSVEGFDGTGSGFSPLLPDSGDGLLISPATLTPRPVNDSDILTVRTVSGCDNFVKKHPAEGGQSVPGSAPLQMSSTDCVQEGDIVIVTDCQVYARFYVSGVTGKNVLHTTATGNCPNGVEGKRLGKAWTGGQIMRTAIRTYYVGETSRNVRALYVIENGRAPQELVEGVESLELLYGFDADDDRAANEYRTASAVGADWAKVRSVRVGVLVHSADANATELTRETDFNGQQFGGDDRRLRLAFDTTATIRNLVP
jgi:type IV pilus assembly protein PilW